jgi:hypothetical protein
LGGTRERC